MQMKRFTIALALALGATGALAQLADGEIRKVDKEAKKVTIKHGEIKSIDMPPMTMVFRVRNAELLEAVKPGDKVKFDAQKEGGQYVVTRIERAK
jgi:Cu/Ag efflux protein CusF